MFTLHHVLHVTCHMSCAMCHVSNVTCYMYFFYFFLKCWRQSVEGVLSAGLTPSSFYAIVFTQLKIPSLQLATKLFASIKANIGLDCIKYLRSLMEKGIMCDKSLWFIHIQPSPWKFKTCHTDTTAGPNKIGPVFLMYMQSQ